MKTFARATVLVLLTFGLVACGGGEKERKDEVEQPQMTDAEALVGTWGSGGERLTFTPDGTFTWESPRPCGAPPCPMSSSQGTWQLRHGKLYLDPQSGDDRVLMYSLARDPRTVELSEKASGKSWSYTYAQ